MVVNAELEKALLEVRKAYRLIAIYQRRILDMAKVIQTSFGYKSYIYDNNYHNINIGGNGRFPTDRWSIDMLPMYNDFSMLYLPDSANYNHPKTSEFMLEIRFISDNGYKKDASDPFVEDFSDVNTSETIMCLYAFGPRKNLLSTYWDKDVWKKIDYPHDGEILINDDVWAVGKSYNLAMFQDEKALKDVIIDFKAFIQNKKDEIK